MAHEREDAARIGCSKVALIMAPRLLKIGGALGGGRDEIDVADGEDAQLGGLELAVAAAHAQRAEVACVDDGEQSTVQQRQQVLQVVQRREDERSIRRCKSALLVEKRLNTACHLRDNELGGRILRPACSRNDIAGYIQIGCGERAAFVDERFHAPERSVAVDEASIDEALARANLLIREGRYVRIGLRGGSGGTHTRALLEL